MYDDRFSTRSNQPKPAREITLRVQALEHQATVNALPFEYGSHRLAQTLKALPGKMRLLLATLF